MNLTELYSLYNKGLPIDEIAKSLRCTADDIMTVFTPKPAVKSNYAGEIKVPVFNYTSSTKKGTCPRCFKFVTLPCLQCHLLEFLNKYGNVIPAEIDPDYELEKGVDDDIYC